MSESQPLPLSPPEVPVPVATNAAKEAKDVGHVKGIQRWQIVRKLETTHIKMERHIATIDLELSNAFKFSVERI
jgi:hypothetical protein